MYTSLKPKRQTYVGKNNIIEINGKRYDAKTGRMLSVVKRPTMSDVVRPSVKHVPAHAPKTSKTLMRNAVKKPAASHKQGFKAHGHTDHLAKRPLADIAPKPSARRVDNKRLQKAGRIAKSSFITHFAPIVNDNWQPPAQPVRPPQQPLPIGAKPNKKVKPQTTADILEQALRHANSHEQPAHKSPRRSRTKRRVGVAAASVLVVAVAGFVGSQQLPNARLRMASAKAGFSVDVPDYKPAGYSLGKLNYSEGIASTEYQSNSDDRSYTITQKLSEWDSTALRDSFVVSQDSKYTTVKSGGKTIYLYGGHNATWVNAGVWYIIQGNDSLSNHQLVDLAKSL